MSDTISAPPGARRGGDFFSLLTQKVIEGEELTEMEELFFQRYNDASVLPRLAGLGCPSDLLEAPPEIPEELIEEIFVFSFAREKTIRATWLLYDEFWRGDQLRGRSKVAVFAVCAWMQSKKTGYPLRISDLGKMHESVGYNLEQPMKLVATVRRETNYEQTKTSKKEIFEKAFIDVYFRARRNAEGRGIDLGDFADVGCDANYIREGFSVLVQHPDLLRMGKRPTAVAAAVVYHLWASHISLNTYQDLVEHSNPTLRTLLDKLGRGEQ